MSIRVDSFHLTLELFISSPFLHLVSQRVLRYLDTLVQIFFRWFMGVTVNNHKVSYFLLECFAKHIVSFSKLYKTSYFLPIISHRCQLVLSQDVCFYCLYIFGSASCQKPIFLRLFFSPYVCLFLKHCFIFYHMLLMERQVSSRCELFNMLS